MKINFKKYFNSAFLILFLILLLGIFLRIYKLEIFYSFGHDQDLSAWIAKDIVIDRHLRLIGQETSVLGVFVGPLFYYLVAGSFWLFNMHPLSGVLITITLGLLTIFSIYFVFSKFFNKNVGLFGSLIYAVSPGLVFWDRWVVPTQPTILWSVWFLYVLLFILKGNFNILIPLAVLVGLIWHIHIALLPLLILVPIAYFLSDKKENIKYSLKTIIISLSIFIILVSPFAIFEIKYNGIQIKSLIFAAQDTKDDLAGLDRLHKTFISSGKSFIGTFAIDNPIYNFNPSIVYIFLSLFFVGIMYLKFAKILTNKQVSLFVTWYLLVFLGQFFSKKTISEYYFSNLTIILLLVIALILDKSNKIFKNLPLATFLLIIYSLFSIVWIINRPEGASGYHNKKEAIEIIRDDVVNKGYPCIGINHIEPKQNIVSGFRYLFWYYGLNVIKPSNDIPVYSIVNPWTISKNEINAKSGDIGVIFPIVKEINPEICSESNRQLLPLWGFNN